MKKKEAEATCLSGSLSTSAEKKPCGEKGNQTTMYKFFQASSSSSSSSSTPKPKVIVTPQIYGIHVYTPAEIEQSHGLQKSFRNFWNEKAYELCSNNSKLIDKYAIQGAIYCSWTLHKTKLLQLEAEQLKKDMESVYTDTVTREYILTPVNRNLSESR